MSNTTMDVPKTGFSFDLCRRNDMLAKKGLKPPGYLKTGTTIVGLIFEVRCASVMFGCLLACSVNSFICFV